MMETTNESNEVPELLGPVLFLRTTSLSQSLLLGYCNVSKTPNHVQ